MHLLTNNETDNSVSAAKHTCKTPVERIGPFIFMCKDERREIQNTALESLIGFLQAVIFLSLMKSE